MRLKNLATLIETADPNTVYVIGDSHAVAVGAGIKGATVLAENGAKLQALILSATSRKARDCLELKSRIQ